MSIELMSREQGKLLQPRLYLLYHELRPSPSEYSYVMEPRAFQEHINLFAQLRKTDNTGLWPEVTFDDGHFSNFEYALPILQSRNLKAWFFITVGWTGRREGFMGWAELRQLLEAGQSLGAHGWSHTLLTHCAEKDLKLELGHARLTLEDKLGTSITTMSLPGGRYNRRILSACRDAGYTQVYTSVPRIESMPLGDTIGRLNILGHMEAEWVSNLFRPESGILTGLGRQYQMKAAAKAILGDRLYEKLWSVVNRREEDRGGNGDHAE